MPSILSKSIQMSHSTFSVKRRGATKVSPAIFTRWRIASNAERSILPWAVSGMRSRKMNPPGIM